MLGRARSVVLVTGMSGTGKSTALNELARRGHEAVDTDDPGWLAELQTADGPEPVWKLDVVLARVANRANPFGSTPRDRAKIADRRRGRGARAHR